jgi:hypothetical protein
VGLCGLLEATLNVLLKLKLLNEPKQLLVLVEAYDKRRLYDKSRLLSKLYWYLDPAESMVLEVSVQTMMLFIDSC